MPTTLIRNIRQLATPAGNAPVRGRAMRELRVIDNPVLLVRDGRWAFVGKENDLPADLRSAIDNDIDAAGSCVVPGFVDAHTHLPFAGTRETEFNRRLQGESYSDIAAGGGGILATLTATRGASRQDLVSAMRPRVERMALHGTTTAEAKSGYGLNLPDEIKQLEAIAELRPSSPVRLLSTCLAAHEFPPEYRGSRGEYVQLILDEILPAVADRNLAIWCDAFVEEGVFTAADGERILRRGIELGLVPRLHADELTDTGGAALAARLGAASADHLMYISERGIAALAASETAANLLPATSLFLLSERFAPARALIDAGAIVALSTDCNPGSSMTESMPLVIQLACLRMRLTVEEALTAATINSASTLGLASETGTIEPGKRADAVFLDAPNYFHLVYHFGVNLVRDVMRDGTFVVRDGRIAAQT